jgi:hypothetical protein
MNNFQIGFLGLFFVGCLCTFSLWENPPEWRKPRQTEGGIFHRQAAARSCCPPSAKQVLILFGGAL